jgi:hypothetical protein
MASVVIRREGGVHPGLRIGIWRGQSDMIFVAEDCNFQWAVWQACNATEDIYAAKRLTAGLEFRVGITYV